MSRPPAETTRPRPLTRRGFFDVGAALLAGAGLALLGVTGCTRPTHTPDAAPARGEPPEVVFYPASGSPTRVRVELARTQQEQMRGLMYRRELGADDGMLFIFDQPEIRRFWMRNTYVPLDMIFLDGKRTVVGIEENTVPLDETSRGPDREAQYVVEVRAGYARLHGIAAGARAEFRHVD